MIAEPRYAIAAALSIGAIAAAPVSAHADEAASTPQASVEQAEIATEAAADSLEAAEIAAEQAETEAEAASPYEFKSKKAAEEYPSIALKIERIRRRIAEVSARKAALEALPEHAKGRKVGLPVKTAKIKEQRQHLREVRAELRAKKVAARE